MRTLPALPWITLALGTCFAGFAAAAPTKPLASGVAQTETVAATGLSTSFYIDVPASAQQLTIEVSGANAGQDIDLFLRLGVPFPDSVNGAPPTDTYLQEFAQYQSISERATESIQISRSNAVPVQAGRWYIAAINYSGTPAEIQVRATTSETAPGNLPITVLFDDTSDGCDVSGWNDATAKAPIGGNTGTTLGQQRRNAINEAARLLSAGYVSPVPVRIQACWKNLGTGNSIALASASPQFELIGNRFLPRRYTWYTSGAAAKLGGGQACQIAGGSCSQTELFAQFNNQVDTPAALGNTSFYYGLTANPTGQDIDFISVAMHELTHGLGFTGDINDDASRGVVGSKQQGFDDIYSSNLVDVRPDGSIVPFMNETDAERAAALVGINRLRWTDPLVTGNSENRHRSEDPPANYVQIYTPNPTKPGSTLSHLSFDNPGQLMLPEAIAVIRTSGLSQPMLQGVGWSAAEQPATSQLLTRNTLMFDPKHAGHGIDFARVVDNIYFMVFYTYDAAGEPEWYIAIGPMVDGVFMPGVNAQGSSLVRYKFVAGGTPQQQPDPSSSGQVRLDFNGARNHPSCNDGRSLASGDPVAVMTWTLGADRNVAWCMQPLISENARGTPDYTGTWYSGTSDSGWGFSFASFDTGNAANRGFFSLIYFPDANGFGRWGFIQTSQLANDTVYTVKQRRGYCRTCTKPDGEFVDVDAGTMSVKLLGATQENVGTGNKVTLDVTFKDAPGGNFKRTNNSVTLLSVPAGQ